MLFRTVVALLSAAAMAGCLGATPERAQITGARAIETRDGLQLEVTQQLKLSRTMLGALSSGIPLRLIYGIDACDAGPRGAVVELRYVALTDTYELHHSADGDVRRFGRRSALLAALDRIRLPLGTLPAECAGTVTVVLDLTTLPTPLRFPAFLKPAEWRLVSPPTAWSVAPA